MADSILPRQWTPDAIKSMREQMNANIPDTQLRSWHGFSRAVILVLLAEVERLAGSEAK